MDYGRFAFLNLCNLYTPRKTKQENRYKKLVLKYKCLVKSLIEFKHNLSYLASIHSIGIITFFVYYWTNRQVNFIYKYLSYYNSNYNELLIIVTGSLVKKQKITCLEFPSFNIILYVDIINKNYRNILVTQMISKKHDPLYIFN